MENEKRICDLQVGDEVLVHPTHRVEYIDKITKITNTQLCINDIKFRKDNGKQVGLSKWDAGYIIIPTEADRQRLKLNIARKNLKAMMETLSEKIKYLTNEEIEILYPIVRNVFHNIKDK